MQQSRKGMFLPGILVTTVLATMFIGAALSLAPSGFLRAQQSGNLSEAERAAQAGLEYALARIQRDVDWNGTAPDILSSADFAVHEKDGNVVGLMRNNGMVSQFRIRFNLQNGTPGHDFDSLPDPPSSMLVDFPLVSFNNLSSGADQTIPKNTSEGRMKDQEVPGRTVYIAVEGRSGKALADLTGGNINAAPGYGGFSRKVLRCSYKLTAAPAGVVDAVTMAANVIHATLPTTPGSSVNMSGDKTPRLRSRANILIDGGDNPNLASSVTGEFCVNQTSTPSVQLGSTTKLTRQDELGSNNFYQIGWDDVPKAPPAAGQLPAGTYVFWDDGSLHYYDMAPKDYPAFIDAHTTSAGVTDSAGAGTVIPLPASLAGGAFKANFNSGKASVDVVADVAVAASPTGVTDVAILPKKGAALDPSSETAGLSSTQVSSMFTSQATNQYALSDSAIGLLAAFGESVVPAGGGNYPITVGPGVANLSTAGNVLNLNGGATLTALIPMIQNFAAANPTDPAVSAYLTANSAQTTGGVPTNAAIKNSSLDPEDISVDLQADHAGKNVILSNNAGSIIFGAQVKGQGSSIVAGNEIQVLGAGTDLSAATDPEKGLNVYAKGDVTLSTYNPDNVTKGKSRRFNKISLRGIVYTWGDFKAILGNEAVSPSLWGSLSLNGTLVAYGGDPAVGVGSNPGKGRVDILASRADLRFDSVYLMNLAPPTGTVSLARAWWSAQ
jgi:hypothetical protein